jgi:hypothetical protein
MGKVYSAATWNLCRDVWSFVAGRDSLRTEEFASRWLPPGETPSARSIREHALADDWAGWAASAPSRIAPALTQAGRDLMTLAYPEAVLTLVQTMRAGDAAAARAIIRQVEATLADGPGAPLPRLPSPHDTDTPPTRGEIARLLAAVEDDAD